MPNKKLERFGKYLLLDHLLDGGMNRIFRARYLGDTASKICAVKVVLPQYSMDPQFKMMFMDEIKVTFGLLHPNIVQTYDYGTHKGQLYVAMEYCDGRNLKEYLDKLRERKFVFPVEISVYIGTQICQGLHYSHTLTDKLSGKEMNIIHRDISPHNIMLTYDGGIKIIDFGIAKAETNSEATQAGTIKGKLSYLAPEYLEGNELDARYDQFAVGITLWEMLCNRKLFKAPNDIAVLKKIQDCEVPKPSSINPNVSAELDEIILKALSKNPINRFDNMDMLNRALIKFLYSKYPDFNATDLSYFAKELFKEDIQKDREKLFEFGKIDLAPYIEDMKIEARGETDEDETIQANVGSKERDTANDRKKVSKAAVFDFGFSQEEKARTESGTRILNRKKVNKAINQDFTKTEAFKSMPKKKAVEKKRTEAKSNSVSARKGTSSPNPPTIKKGSKNNTSTSNIKNKIIRERSKTSVSDAKKSSFKLIVASVALVLAGVVFFTQKKEVVSKKPRNIASNTGGLSSTNGGIAKETEKLGRIELINFDKFNMHAFINGAKQSVDVLGIIENVKYGDHYLRIEEKGANSFVEKISLNNRSKLVKVNIPELKAGEFGYLEVGADCFRGEIEFTLFGEKRVEKVPFIERKNIGFPVSEESVYEIFYSKYGDSLKKRINFSITKPDDVIDFCDLIL